VPNRGGLANAGIGGQRRKTWLFDKMSEDARQAQVRRTLVVEGLALGVLG
jgi:hypothetical protein